jgi:hypothetical protein
MNAAFTHNYFLRMVHVGFDLPGFGSFKTKLASPSLPCTAVP